MRPARYEYRPFMYAPAEAGAIRSCLSGCASALELWDVATLPALTSAAGEYLSRVDHDRRLPDFERYTGQRKRWAEAIAEVVGDQREAIWRSDAVRAAVDDAAEQPARFAGDSSIAWLSERFLAGEIKQTEFEHEIFHRVLDRYERMRAHPAARVLPFESSHKDNKAPRTREGWPVRRFQQAYIERLYDLWADFNELGLDEVTVSRGLKEFVSAAAGPVLEIAGEPLSERGLETKLHSIRKARKPAR